MSNTISVFTVSHISSILLKEDNIVFFIYLIFIIASFMLQYHCKF